VAAGSDEATQEIVRFHSSAETGIPIARARATAAVESAVQCRAATATCSWCRAMGKQRPETAGSRKQIVIPHSHSTAPRRGPSSPVPLLWMTGSLPPHANAAKRRLISPADPIIHNNTNIQASYCTSRWFTALAWPWCHKDSPIIELECFGGPARGTSL
jgi:hypothetical protein